MATDFHLHQCEGNKVRSEAGVPKRGYEGERSPSVQKSCGLETSFGRTNPQTHKPTCPLHTLKIHVCAGRAGAWLGKVHYQSLESNGYCIYELNFYLDQFPLHRTKVPVIGNER